MLLPALLAQTRIVTLWDLLFVKFGKDPHKTVRLFHGLRRAQARIAVLLGRLQTVKAGEAAVRQGEQGEEMYVIINGRLVRVPPRGPAMKQIAGVLESIVARRGK